LASNDSSLPAFSWPLGRHRASRPTLWRWLGQALAERRLCRGGTGGNGDPFHSWLAEKEASLRDNSLQEMA